jgi:nicotinamidase/pyrazinamidase
MNRLFFFDIDTQRDFMLPGGALYVPGAEKLVPKLRRLVDCARRNGILIVSSVDAHAPADTEFQQFPPHCVKGTEGQRKIDDTVVGRPLVLENRPLDRNLLQIVAQNAQIVVEKQALDVFTNPITEKLIRALPQFAVVFGVTTEHCVRHAVLGLRRRSVKTAVVSDAIAALSPETGRAALDEMRAAGAELTTTDALLQAYAA